jgi:iron-sulfur cluster assembly accessory protein
VITVTDTAAVKVKELLEAEGDLELALRVAVRPGGCSGFSYEMFFDGDVAADDEKATFGNPGATVNVVVDSASAQMLEGATLDYTDRYMRQVEGILLSVPECKGLFTATGLGFGGPGRVTNGFVFMQLKPHGERNKSQQQIVQELFFPLISIPGVLAFLINPPSLGQDFAAPVQYVLQADTYESLQQGVGIMMSKASQLGYLVNLDTDLRLNKPEPKMKSRKYSQRDQKIENEDPA